MITLSLFCSLCHSKIVWYVKSYNEQKCPNSSTCHTLSFYSQNVTFFFVSNTTFVFIKGEHKLEKHLLIAKASQIVFKSIFEYEYEGKDNSVISPTINYTTAEAGLQFINSSYVSLEGLVVNGCSSSSGAGISFHNVSSVNIYNTTIQNTYGTGVLINNSAFITISGQCFFKNNGLGVKNCSIESTQLGHSLTIISNSLEEVYYNISDSVFVGNLPALGGGLHLYTTNTVFSEVAIKGCHFSHVVGCLATAANISVVSNSDHANITVLDSVFYKNHRNNSINKKQVLGGGLKLNLLQVTDTTSKVSNKSNHSSNIIICNSKFLHNNATHGAGVGIIIDANVNPSNILVSNSNFSYNIANERGGGLYVGPTDNIPGNEHIHFIKVVNSVFFGNQAGWEGTGLLIWPWWNSSSQFNIFVNSCYFDSNSHFGYKHYGYAHAVLVLRLFSRKKFKTTNSIIVTNCSFVNNNGSGVYVTTYNRLRLNQDTFIVHKLNIKIFNCYFGENIGHFMASLYLTLNPKSISMLISHCIFNGNAALHDVATAAMKIFYFIEDQTTSSIHLSNVTVTQSKTGRNAIHLVCLNIGVQVDISNIQVHDNNMTGIGCDRCGLHFSGYNIIANNTTPYAGGGLVLNNSGYAVTEKNASVNFINNTASKGGALYSNTHNPYSTTLLFLYCTFTDFKVNFQNNTSIITGDNLYGGLFYHCSTRINNTDFMYADVKDALNCTKTVFITQDYASVSSDPFTVCLCTYNSINFFKNGKYVVVYPGQSFNISLITVGYCGNSSPGTLVISSSPNLQLISNTDNDKTSIRCKPFVYKAIQLLSNVSHGTATISVSSTLYPFSKSLTLRVQFLNCPSGMILGSSCECVCNDIIASYVQCNISWQQYPLLKSAGNNVWLGFEKDYNCTIAYENCPFDYCKSSEIKFNLDNDTDLQCNYKRTGLLCGQCQSGLSLKLGSNVCSKCTNIYLLLLIVFMFSGILLVALLITLNLTVSVGTINGLLFYANILKLNEAVFFPNGNIIIVSQFISWINLDFGIEVCLFDGLDGYWKTWLQFVFPFYVWSLVAGIIIISQQSTRLSKTFGRNIVPVLATLILMSFTKLLRTTTNALMTSNVKCASREWTVWSVDGNINYGTTKHSILVAFSVVVLVFSIIYSCLIFSTQWLQRYSHLCCRSRNDPILKLLPFIDAYTGPYKERYRFWTGFLLIVRLLLTAIFINTSGSLHIVNDYIIILVEVIILYILQHNVYRDKRLSFLEQFFHINLFIVALVNSFINQSTYKVYTPFITIISIAVAMVMFILTILIHVYWKLKKMQCFKDSRREEIQPLLDKSSGDKSDDEIYSPCRTIRRRESLIFDLVAADLIYDNK